MSNTTPRHFFDTDFATEQEWEIFRHHYASPLGGPSLHDVPFLMNELRDEISRKKHIVQAINELELVPSQYFGLNDWLMADNFLKNPGK